MGIYQYLHEHRVEISFTFIVIGFILLAIGFGSIMASEDDTGFFGSIKDSAGSWIYWVAFSGALICLLGAFYFIDFYVKRREFYRLFGERSKSKFIKNLDRIEELAWRLHPKYEELVIDKKKEMRIR